MKPVLFRIPKPETASFRVQVDNQPYFYDTLHYHPEVQLTLILEGSGTRLVGDNIARFQAGDVYLIGSNVPHVFRCDEQYYTDESQTQCHGISIFFAPNLFGERFTDIPEMHQIRDLIRESRGGLVFGGDIRKRMAKLIPQLIELDGFPRLANFLQLLDELSNSSERKSISDTVYVKPQREADNKRLNAVFDYIMVNYHREISLEEVAGVASMAPTAFCRFFKHRTRKTFSRFLNEVRVSNACKLLVEEDLSIAEAAWKSGFNNLSNFNRQFRSIRELTPSQYLHRFKRQAHAPA